MSESLLYSYIVFSAIDTMKVNLKIPCHIFVRQFEIFILALHACSNVPCLLCIWLKNLKL